MRRGELWLVAFDLPVRAGEPAKTRPALVVSADRFNRTRAPTVVVVPLTTVAHGHPLHVEIDVPELDAPSYAQTELVGVVSKGRLVHHLATLDEVIMGDVSVLIATLLDL